MERTKMERKPYSAGAVKFSFWFMEFRKTVQLLSEGKSFADIKKDMEFRRYLYRGKANVTAQSILLAIGYNINKLHHKIQAGRTGRHLFPLKQTA